MNSIFEQALKDIKNLPKPIAIIGLGTSGESASALLKACGCRDQDMILFDEKSPRAQIQLWNDLLAAGPKSIVLSPGVPLLTPSLQTLIRQGIPVISEVALGLKFVTDEFTVGITGSLGKSTTAALVGAALHAYDSDVFVGGNFGVPMTDFARLKLEGRKLPRCLVIELSSYQLELPLGRQLDWSVFSYFAPNHLERYPDLNAYYAAKYALVAQTQRGVFLNQESSELVEYFKHKKTKESSPGNARLHWVSSDAKDPRFVRAKLLGAHNRQNMSLATALVQAIISEQLPHDSWDFLKAINEFPGLPHRLENLGVHHHLRWINDSKATALDSVRTAIATCLSEIPDGSRLWVLLGGKDKKLPWGEMSYLRDIKKIQAVFFGESRELIAQTSGVSGESFPKLEQAVQYCRVHARPDDWVLLSPGGTSLDEFKNFEHRGEFFKFLATKL